MTREEFERRRHRFGDDIGSWPAPYRREAETFLAQDGRRADTGEGLDRLVLESVLAPTDEQALARTVLARIGRTPRPGFAVWPGLRPLAFPVAAMSLALVLAIAAAGGYMAGDLDGELSDDALLAFATGEPPPGLMAPAATGRTGGGPL